MIADLFAYTDIAEYCLFDPAALADIVRSEWPDGPEFAELDKQQAQGNVLRYSIAADGDTVLRLFIDEPAPAELLERAHHRTENALLRVPSGVLCWVGTENIQKWGRDPFPARREGKLKPDGEAVRLPAGNYRVYAGQLGEDYDSDGDTGCCCFGCIGALLTAGAFLLVPRWYFTAQARPWRIPLALAVAAAVLVWIILIVAWTKRRGKAVKVARNPPRIDAFAVLTRLPEGADLTGMEGGAFGSAYAPDVVTPRDVQSIERRLHDARFADGDIMFDPLARTFTLKCRVNYGKRGGPRGWGVYQLSFNQVSSCDMEGKERVPYYEINTIRYSESDHTIRILTHTPLSITLTVNALDGQLKT